MQGDETGKGRSDSASGPAALMLSDNHRRAIAAALVTVADWLDEIRSLATTPGRSDVLRCVQDDLSPETRQRLIELIDEAFAVMEQIAVQLRLPQQKRSLSRQIAAACAVMWEDLVETQSARLRRYGRMSPAAADFVDTKIEQIIRIVGRIDALACGVGRS